MRECNLNETTITTTSTTRCRIAVDSLKTCQLVYQERFVPCMSA
jgi:hypothetical protein